MSIVTTPEHTTSQEYRWANERRAHGMPTPDMLAAEGYVRIAQHPNYPASWLMRRDGREKEEAGR